MEYIHKFRCKASAFIKGWKATLSCLNWFQLRSPFHLLFLKKLQYIFRKRGGYRYIYKKDTNAHTKTDTNTQMYINIKHQLWALVGKHLWAPGTNTDKKYAYKYWYKYSIFCIWPQIRGGRCRTTLGLRYGLFKMVFKCGEAMWYKGVGITIEHCQRNPRWNPK